MRLAFTCAAFLFISPVFAQTTVRLTGGPPESNGISSQSAISRDGRWVGFSSLGSNLVGGDANGVADVFLVDFYDATSYERISVSSASAEGNAGSFHPSASEDGRYVAFESDASNLIGSDSNGLRDVFLRDRQSGTTVRLSESSLGAEGNGNSIHPDVSDDGRYIVFESGATNLIGSDSNGVDDVFIHDTLFSSTWRLSQGPGGAGNGASGSPSISGNGRYVAFESSAYNLVLGDTNGASDIFVYDRVTGLSVRVSFGGLGQSDGGSYNPDISQDGRFVVFESDATNLDQLDSNGLRDVFIHDRDPDENSIFDEGNGLTSMISFSTLSYVSDADCFAPSLSDDGRYVVFHSESSTLDYIVTNGVNDVFIRDRQSNTTWRSSLTAGWLESNGASSFPAMSGDGKHVAFESEGTNLVADDLNGLKDIFVRDYCSAAYWQNYEGGWQGTLGVPAFTSQDDPVLCTTVNLDLENSRGATTLATVFYGLTPAGLQSSWGGIFNVMPTSGFSLMLPSNGVTLPFPIPCQSALCGFSIYLQAVMVDPGASHGYAFTQGLMLTLGN